MLSTFFKLVGKALRMGVSRPIQRFNIFGRVKKHLGEDSKYFMPAPRAIGALSQQKPGQYPHLEGGSGFKSIREKRLEAIAERNQRLLQRPTNSDQADESNNDKSFSETIHDDKLVISTSTRLPVIKTVTTMDRPKVAAGPDDSNQLAGGGELVQKESHRPLPKSVNLQLSDPAVIWRVDKVPPGRLDLNKLQELMINKLADDTHWTPKKIAETYNIKEEYAENVIKYLKQIRIILSPRIANKLDYVARNDPVYQATKHIIYHVDTRLRDERDKQFDDTFLPTDDLEPEIRQLLEKKDVPAQQPDPRLAFAMKRPEPLRLKAINKPGEDANKSSQIRQLDKVQEASGEGETPPKSETTPKNIREQSSYNNLKKKSNVT